MLNAPGFHDIPPFQLLEVPAANFIPKIFEKKFAEKPE